jgi:hypothetical protein
MAASALLVNVLIRGEKRGHSEFYCLTRRFRPIANIDG